MEFVQKPQPIPVQSKCDPLPKLEATVLIVIFSTIFMAPKKYGLIITASKKKGATLDGLKKPSVFAESSSEEEVRLKMMMSL